ncbi:MAG: NTP transferase domain-containing protein [Salinivirgaceae bacterium]|nr:NTP transferase domain-containing protein [Salinivirgaceae bacterium]
MSINYTKHAVVILSAGFSARMGYHKALLKFNNELNFIEKITATYINTGITSISLVVNSELYHYLLNKPFKQQHLVILIENKTPEKGRLHSLKLGIQQFKNQAVFIQNIDNPFVTQNLLKTLSQQLLENSFVNPSYKGKGGHPILLDKNVAQAILSSKSETLKEALSDFHKIKVEVADANILVNINSKEDYREYFGSNESR